MSNMKTLKYIPIRFWHSITYKWLEFKSFFPRGLHGWSNMDTWGFNSYLAQVICGGCKHLRKIKHGYPATLEPFTGEYEYDEGRWNKILDEIIWAFDIYEKCSGSEGFEFYFRYIERSGYTKEDHLNWIKNFEKDFNTHILTEQEDKRMREGMKLFIENLDGLWD